MKISLLVILILVVVLLVISSVFFFILQKPTETESGGAEEIIQPGQIEPEETTPEQPSTPKQETTEPQTYNIKIENFVFSPATITIKAGDTVIWTNKDSSRHTVTSDSGKELYSELLGKEESYSHTFNQQGTFDYYCKPHPYMKAKVIVE